MEIIKLNDQHKQQYEKFVAASDSGSFLQSWGWGEFQTQLGKPAIRYGIFDESLGKQNLIGTVQFFKTKVPHLPGYYLYSPYGPVFNETATTKLTPQIISLSVSLAVSLAVSQVISQLTIDFPDCWFVRFEPKNNLSIKGQETVHIQPGKTLVTNLTNSLDVMQNEMHPKTRYNIKVANKHNIIVESEISVSPQHGFHIAELVGLLTQTSDRQKFRSYGQEYYEKLIDFFILHARATDCKVSLYKALYNKKLVAGAIMIDHGTTRTYLFGGSSDSERNLMAPYALHWQAIRDAKTAGLNYYDWWGIETASGQTPGFVQFKLKWGGEQHSYPPAVDIVYKGGWYLVYKLLRKINRLY